MRNLEWVPSADLEHLNTRQALLVKAAKTSYAEVKNVPGSFREQHFFSSKHGYRALCERCNTPSHFLSIAPSCALYVCATCYKSEHTKETQHAHLQTRTVGAPKRGRSSSPTEPVDLPKSRKLDDWEADNIPPIPAYPLQDQPEGTLVRLTLEEYRSLDHVGRGRSIGRGSFGSVHRLRMNGNAYVVKHFEENNVSEAMRELKTLRALNHSGIPKGLYVLLVDRYNPLDQTTDYLVAIVMTDVGGYTVGVPDPMQMNQYVFVNLLYEIYDILKHVHAAGYVHRDLSRANVLVSLKNGYEYAAYLVDFGMATDTSRMRIWNSRKKPFRRWTPQVNQMLFGKKPPLTGEDIPITDEGLADLRSSDYWAAMMVALFLTTGREALDDTNYRFNLMTATTYRYAPWMGIQYPMRWFLENGLELSRSRIPGETLLRYTSYNTPSSMYAYFLDSLMTLSLYVEIETQLKELSTEFKEEQDTQGEVPVFVAITWASSTGVGNNLTLCLAYTRENEAQQVVYWLDASSDDSVQHKLRLLFFLSETLRTNLAQNPKSELLFLRSNYMMEMQRVFREDKILASSLIGQPLPVLLSDLTSYPEQKLDGSWSGPGPILSRDIVTVVDPSYDITFMDDGSFRIPNYATTYFSDVSCPCRK